MGLEGPVLDPPVEVEQLGAVAVDELAGPQQPIFQIFPVRLWLAEQVVDAALPSWPASKGRRAAEAP